MDDQPQPDKDTERQQNPKEEHEPLSIPATQPPKPEEKPRRSNWFVVALWTVVLLCFGPVLLLAVMWLYFMLTGVTSNLTEVGGWAFLYLLPIFYVLPYFAWPGIAASIILIVLDGNLWRKLLAACIAAAFSFGLLVALSYIS